MGERGRKSIEETSLEKTLASFKGFSRAAAKKLSGQVVENSPFVIIKTFKTRGTNEKRTKREEGKRRRKREREEKEKKKSKSWQAFLEIYNEALFRERL